MNLPNQVYKLVSQIPQGKVTTYKIIAQKLGINNYRIIGKIMSNNPKSVEIPCHRVIRNNGQIGGYKLGTKKKIELLKKEGINIRNNKVVDPNKVLEKFD